MEPIAQGSEVSFLGRFEGQQAVNSSDDRPHEPSEQSLGCGFEQSQVELDYFEVNRERADYSALLQPLPLPNCLLLGPIAPLLGQPTDRQRKLVLRFPSSHPLLMKIRTIALIGPQPNVLHHWLNLAEIVMKDLQPCRVIHRPS